MNFKEGWLVVIGIGIGEAAFALGLFVGRVGIVQDCYSFGAFVDAQGHKWECKKGTS